MPHVVHNGHIKRLTDQDIQSSVLEIMGTNVTNAYITCPQNKEETLGIKLPFLVMIIKNVVLDLFSSKNISLSKCKCLMIRTFAGDLGHRIINQQPGWNHSFAQCQCDWMRVGIRFNSTFLILHVELMAATISKHCEWQSMQIVGSEESTFLTDYIAKKSYLLSSNSFSLSKNSNDRIVYLSSITTCCLYSRIA